MVLIERWKQPINRAHIPASVTNLKEDTMHSVWFGEFMGTLVLVLLGNGVNAGVTLRKSYAADAGWIVITTGWALGVLCGVLVAQAFGSAGANLNPAITLAAAVIERQLFTAARFVVSAVAGRHGRRSAGGSALWAALGAYAGSGGQAWRLLHQCRGAQPIAEHRERSVGHRGAGAGGRRHLLAWSVSKRPGARDWGHGWWPAWCGASASRSAAPPVTPSTRRAILGRVSHIGCFPFPARAARTGAMRPFLLLEILRELHWPGCCFVTRICDFERG